MENGAERREGDRKGSKHESRPERQQIKLPGRVVPWVGLKHSTSLVAIAQLGYNRCLCGQNRVPFYFSVRHAPRTPSGWLGGRRSLLLYVLSEQPPPEEYKKVKSGLSLRCARSKPKHTSHSNRAWKNRLHRLPPRKDYHVVYITRSTYHYASSSSIIVGACGSLLVTAIVPVFPTLLWKATKIL